MPALLPVVLIATHLVLTAQEVPNLNVEPSCRAAANAVSQQGKRDPNACLQDEKQARAKLKKQWGSYSAAERERCVELTTTGGPPSYVELLTCLQMAKDVKKLPAGSGMNNPVAR